MVILFINRSDSTCGNCWKNADPREKSHISWMGYDALAQSKKQGIEYPLAGCGAIYTGVSSEYIGMDDVVKEMRPDLLFVDPSAAFV